MDIKTLIDLGREYYLLELKRREKEMVLKPSLYPHLI